MISPKVFAAIELHETNLRRMRDAVRRSYREGRWAAATDAERLATKRNFRIEQARLRRLLAWVAERQQSEGV